MTDTWGWHCAISSAVGHRSAAAGSRTENNNYLFLLNYLLRRAMNINGTPSSSTPMPSWAPMLPGSLDSA